MSAKRDEELKRSGAGPSWAGAAPSQPSPVAAATPQRSTPRRRATEVATPDTSDILALAGLSSMTVTPRPAPAPASTPTPPPEGSPLLTGIPMPPVTGMPPPPPAAFSRGTSSKAGSSSAGDGAGPSDAASEASSSGEELPPQRRAVKTARKSWHQPESLLLPPKEWVYLDDTGALLGPFPQDQIAEWHKQGHLPDDLMIRDMTDPVAAFVPLDEVLGLRKREEGMDKGKGKEAETPERALPPGQRNGSELPPQPMVKDRPPRVFRRPEKKWQGAVRAIDVVSTMQKAASTSEPPPGQRKVSELPARPIARDRAPRVFKRPPKQQWQDVGKLQAAATRLQALQRGRAARKAAEVAETEALMREMAELMAGLGAAGAGRIATDEEAAAVKLQTISRGYAVRSALAEAHLSLDERMQKRFSKPPRHAPAHMPRVVDAPSGASSEPPPRSSMPPKPPAAVGDFWREAKGAMLTTAIGVEEGASADDACSVLIFLAPSDRRHRPSVAPALPAEPAGAAVAYYTRDGTCEGPVPTEALRDRARRGLLHAGSWVWAPQLPGWSRLGAVSFRSDGLVLRRGADASLAADDGAAEAEGSDDEMPVEWGGGGGGGGGGDGGGGGGGGGGAAASRRQAAGDEADEADTEAGSEGDEGDEGDEGELVVSAQRLEAEAKADKLRVEAEEAEAEALRLEREAETLAALERQAEAAATRHGGHVSEAARLQRKAEAAEAEAVRLEREAEKAGLIEERLARARQKKDSDRRRSTLQSTVEVVAATATAPAAVAPSRFQRYEVTKKPLPHDAAGVGADAGAFDAVFLPTPNSGKNFGGMAITERSEVQRAEDIDLVLRSGNGSHPQRPVRAREDSYSRRRLAI